MCWAIWKEKNARCFEGKTETILEIKFKCIWLLAFWYTLQDVKDEHSKLEFIDSLLEYVLILVETFFCFCTTGFHTL